MATAQGNDDPEQNGGAQEEPRPQPVDSTPQPTTSEQTTGGQQDANELSRQATDPTASLLSLGFIATYTGDYYGELPGERDDSWEMKFQPVIPFRAFDLPNILRISLPYQTGGRGDEGLGDITVFNLTVFNENWGRWGIGPVMTFATDDDGGDGAVRPRSIPAFLERPFRTIFRNRAFPGREPDDGDDFVIGPAIGFVYQASKRLNLGLFSQNVFGGDTAISQLQPIIAYQLGDGWSLSAGDLQFIYDWEENRWLNVPIGFQLGKVTHLGKQAVRFAVNPQYNLLDDDGLEQWKIGFSFTVLIPGP